MLLRLRWPALLLAIFFSYTAAAEDQPLAEQISALNQKSFEGRLEAARQLATHPDSRVDDILQGLIDGRLYVERKTDRIVYADRLEGRSGLRLQDVLDPEDTWETGRRGARRIAVNNQLRSELRGLLANRELFSEKPEIQLSAAERLLADGNQSDLRLLSELEVGIDSKLTPLIETAQLVLSLKSTDEAEVIEGLKLAGTLMHPRVIRETLALAETPELSPNLKRAVDDARKKQLSRQQTYEFIQTLFFGISLGSVLVLAAIGLSITFGVMGVINMAHGELIMLGAYTTWVMQQLMPASPGLALLLALPAAFIVSGSTGILIERGVIRYLYDRPLETLLATFGISLILQQAVRSIFSPLNRSVTSPEWMSGSIEIVTGLSITSNRLYILAFSLLVFAALWLIFNRSRLGLEIRAVMQNREMASAMGIASNRINMLTFGLGSGVAGLAGVALSQITNVGPNLGQAYIIDSFMVVVFGGVGSLWGTLAGGLSIGIGNKLLEPSVGAVAAKIMLLVFIILFIQARPKGLFPQKGRVQ